MDNSEGVNDTVRRLEELVAGLSSRVERLEEELKAQRGTGEGVSAVLDEGTEPSIRSVSEAVPAFEPVSLAKATVPGPALPPPVPLYALPDVAARSGVAERVSRLSSTLRPDDATESSPVDKHPAPDYEAVEAALAGFDTPRRPAKRKRDLETQIATYWFPRIGLGLIALMFVYVAQLYSQGPWPKIGLGYTAAIALAGAGLWQRKRQPVWSEPVIAGGLALSYFVTYAMGFVRPMKVIDSLTLEVTLLSLNVLLVLVVAQWLRSEVVAGVALVLGYFTTGISGTERYALVSVAILSVAAVIFMTVNRWVASTVVAVVATYAAHLYAYLFITRPAGGAPTDVFWHHATHLIAYFTVFALGSAVAQRRILSAPADEEAKDGTAPKRPTPAGYLALVVQLNVGMFVSGMILLLRHTGIYWDQAHLFFFPLAAVTYGLSRVHAPLPGARNAYRMAAAVGLAFGIIASASPAWLPVLLAAQAIGMLLLAGRERSLIWWALSLAALLYAGLECMFPGQVWLLQLGPRVRAPMEWWTVMAVAALSLAYAGPVWRKVRWPEMPPFKNMDHFICGATAVLYAWGITRYTQQANEEQALLWAGPVIVAAAIALRMTVWLTFVLVLTVLGALTSAFGAFWSPTVPIVTGVIYALMGMAGGVALEKLGTGERRADLRCAAFLYFGVHVAIAAMLGRHLPGEWFVPAMVASALVTIILAVQTGSRRLFWSASFPAAVAAVVFMVQWGSTTGGLLTSTQLLLSGILMTGLALVFGTRSVGRRVGEDPDARRQPLTEFLLMLAAGAMISAWGHTVFGLSSFVVIALFGAFVIAGAVVAGRTMLVGIGVFFLFLSVLVLGVRAIEPRAVAEGAQVAWSAMLTAVLMVAAERVLVYRSRFQRFRRSEDEVSAFSDETIGVLGVWLGTGGLAVLLLGVYAHPSVRSFYLSAAIVGAGFAWIVLGLLFKSAIYRKLGFGVVCFAVLKALGYDSLRFSRELQIVSLGTLGGILLLAGWLYGRYRNRGVEEEGNDHEPLRPDTD